MNVFTMLNFLVHLVFNAECLCYYTYVFRSIDYNHSCMNTGDHSPSELGKVTACQCSQAVSTSMGIFQKAISISTNTYLPHIAGHLVTIALNSTNESLLAVPDKSRKNERISYGLVSGNPANDSDRLARFMAGANY